MFLLLCFGSLFCCVTQLCFSFSLRTDDWTFLLRAFCYRAEHPRIITLPPPCFTVGMTFLL
uniref:Uncharacterized protein n=1 Tax=Anguilla anguilla TaxID=7936 RepID=A0A0E9WMB6_ANGAN